MANNLDERLLKLKRMEQQEALRALLREIDQQIQTMQLNTFRIYDEDLNSIKEDLVLDAAQKLHRAVKEARKLQQELGDLTMAGRKEEAYYEQARRLYVRENKTMEQIVELLHGEVALNTLYKWSKKGDWGKERAAALTNPKDIAEWLRQMLHEQMEAIRVETQRNPAKLSAVPYDEIYKATLAIEKLEKTANLRTAAIAVMEAYRDFLRGLGIPQEELQMHGNRMREFFRSLE